MRISALMSLAFATLLVVAPATAAPVFDIPQALVTYAYKPYADGTFPDDPYELFTPSLKHLITTAMANASGNELGPLDFDPFIDAQDYEDVTATVDKVTFSGERAQVDIVVTSFGAPMRMRMFVIKGDAGWLIDDIARIDSENPWRLSVLLASDPLLN